MSAKTCSRNRESLLFVLHLLTVLHDCHHCRALLSHSGPGTTELFLAVFFDFQQRKVLGWASFSYVPGSEIDEKRAGRSGRRRDLRRR